MNLYHYQPPERITTCLNDVEAKPIEWLWKPYLPTGMLSLLSGDPGSGKTYLSLSIAAELSVGRVPGSEQIIQPVNTLYLSRENLAEYVVRPRFDVLGGDPKRFHLLAGEVSLSDTDKLLQAISETSAGLVIVDPLQSYLGAEVDAHRANETRPILDGLGELADMFGCCILIVRHLTKSSGGRAIHRGQGSIDFTGAARSELLAGTAPDGTNKRAMVQIKSNVGPYGYALGYTIDDNGFTWTGKSDLTASDLLSSENSSRRESDLEGAVEYLKIALASGPRLQQELVKEEIYPEWTLQRAAKKLGLKRTREGERGAWLWRLG